MNVAHAGLQEWVRQMAGLTGAAAVHWCDGSVAELKAMFALLERAGTALPLNPAKRPNSYLVRSDPADVARVEERGDPVHRDEGDEPEDAGH